MKTKSTQLAFGNRLARRRPIVPIQFPPRRKLPGMNELSDRLQFSLESNSMGSSVIRLKNAGRLDFWTLGNEIAGRSRRYRRVVIDEAAFAKNGDNKVDGSMMEIWEKAIKPTLFDYGGDVLICSNSAGKNPDKFFLQYLYRPELRI